jgi:8-oxo-dGTP pyrophosphatase MutT (NUDIX family)
MNNILKRLLTEAYRLAERVKARDSVKESGGIVILKSVDADWHFLALIKKSGKYDIAKGVREKGETVFDCAKREASEEASLLERDLNFTWGKISNSYGRGTAYIATTTATPTIKPNPETGLKEHIGIKWVPYKEMIANVSDFLIPSIKWAYKIAKKG